MAFQPVPDVLEVAMEWTNAQGSKAVNVLHFREATLASWSAANINAFLDDLVDWENTSGKTQRSNELTLTAIRARDLTTENGAIVTRGVSIVGGAAAAALPLNCTLAVSLRTGLAGRSFRGRIYFIGLTESSVTGNVVATANATAILNSQLGLMDVNGLGNVKLVVVSRVSAGVVRATGLATDVTAMLLVDNRVDTQRRRLD